MPVPCTNHTGRNQPEPVEISSSPSDSGDLAILNVSPAPPRPPTNIIYDEDLEDLVDDDVVELSSSTSTTRPSERFSQTTSVDDVEITNVQLRPPRPGLNLPLSTSSSLFRLMSDAEITSHRARRSRPRPSRNDVNRPRPVTPQHYWISHTHPLELFRQQLLLDRAANGQIITSEQMQLQEAMRLSIIQLENSRASTRPTPPSKSIDVPTDVREGYTRTIDPLKVYLCSWCETELNQGIPEKTKANTEIWDAKYRGTSESDAELSKRVFFSPCSHVYCGWCVKRIITRPKGQKPKKDHTYNNTVIASCCVAECKKPFRAKFTELFC